MQENYTSLVPKGMKRILNCFTYIGIQAQTLFRHKYIHVFVSIYGNKHTHIHTHVHTFNYKENTKYMLATHTSTIRISFF